MNTFLKKYRIRYHRCSFHFLSQTNKTTEMGIVTNAKTRKMLFLLASKAERDLSHKRRLPQETTIIS